MEHMSILKVPYIFLVRGNKASILMKISSDIMINSHPKFI